MKMNRKRALFTVLLLVLSVLIAVPGAHSGAAGTAGARTVMKVGVNNMAAQWDPAARFSNNSMKMHSNMHDGLVRVDPYSTDLTPKPMLAVSWKQISSTATEFRLREGVKFWDGSTVTAEDVAWSFNRSINKEYPAYTSYAYGRILYNFKQVEVVNSTTVRVHTVKPEPLLFTILSQTPAAIVSKKAFEAMNKDYAKYVRSPVGCGPYKIKEFRDDEFLKLERHEQYWGEPAPLKELHYYLIPEATARITALVNGEVDFADSIPPDQAGTLQGRKGIKVLASNPLLFHVYQLNTNRHPLSDQKIRMAFNLAIDRELLNKSLWAGKGIVPTAFQHPSTPGYDPKWKLFEYNPEKARQLVREAKYDGTPIEMEIPRYYYPYAEQAAEAIAKMLQDVGLKAQVTFLEDYKSSGQAPKDLKGYHMMRAWSNTASIPFEPIGIIPDWYPTDWPASTGLVRQWAPEGHPTLPKGEYRDKYVGLFQEARYSADRNARFQAFRKFVEHIHYDVTPWVVLYTPAEYYGMAEDIQWAVPPNYHPYTYPFRAGEIKFR